MDGREARPRRKAFRSQDPPVCRGAVPGPAGRRGRPPRGSGGAEIRPCSRGHSVVHGDERHRDEGTPPGPGCQGLSRTSSLNSDSVSWLLASWNSPSAVIRSKHAIHLGCINDNVSELDFTQMSVPASPRSWASRYSQTYASWLFFMVSFRRGIATKGL